MQISNFLRTALRLDAASCLGLAAVVLPTASRLEAPLGVDASLLAAAAGALVPIGLFILWLGSKGSASASLVWIVIAGNVAWSIGSFEAAAQLPSVTALGQSLIVAQALAVLGVTALEWIGLRSSQRATASV